jgi:hypothetical protein
MQQHRMPLDDSQQPDTNPEPSQTPVVFESPSQQWKIAAVFCALLTVMAIGYAWLQRNATHQLAAEREELRVSLERAKTQEDALGARLNALTAAQAQQDQLAHTRDDMARIQAETLTSDQAPLAETTPAPQHKVHPTATHTTVRRRVPADDPRWKQMQQQLTDQQKQLADNQQQLAQNNQQIAKTQSDLESAKSDLSANLDSARTQLGGDIARNHDELVALEKKGERTYYEFNFEKSKTYHHAGPVSLALRKADSKHEYCDLDMVVDDKTMSRKHVNLYESITLYPEGYPQPVEVIINHIDKDSVRGYVSEPKYKSTERAAASAPAPVPTANQTEASPSSSEPKLEHRDDTVTTH